MNSWLPATVWNMSFDSFLDEGEFSTSTTDDIAEKTDEITESARISGDLDGDATLPGNNDLDGDATLPGISEGEIVVIRSARRKRNISAYRAGGRIVVSIPARMSKADERAMVPEMVAKIRAQEAAITMSESALAARIDELLLEFAPEITIRPADVTWRAMRERWGSCTSVDRTIRISDRLKGAPPHALDFVLFHEAIHLQVFNHSPAFKEILGRFPKAEVASAYLDGYEAAETALALPEALRKLLHNQRAD